MSNDLRNSYFQHIYLKSFSKYKSGCTEDMKAMKQNYQKLLFEKLNEKERKLLIEFIEASNELQEMLLIEKFMQGVDFGITLGLGVSKDDNDNQ